MLSKISETQKGHCIWSTRMGTWIDQTSGLKWIDWTGVQENFLGWWKCSITFWLVVTCIYIQFSGFVELNIEDLCTLLYSIVYQQHIYKKNKVPIMLLLEQNISSATPRAGGEPRHNLQPSRMGWQLRDSRILQSHQHGAAGGPRNCSLVTQSPSNNPIISTAALFYFFWFLLYFSYYPLSPQRK